MTQAPAAVNYEIYTFDGQRWTLHARYPRFERDQAVEEAKQIERTLFIGAKVVRETYYPGNNRAEESIVYISEKSLLHATAQRRRIPPLPDRGGGNSAERTSRTPKTNRTSRPLNVLARMIIVLAAAFAGAGAVSGIVGAFIEHLAPRIILPSDTTAAVLFSCFLLAFLVIAVPLSMSLLNWRQKKRSRRGRTPAPATAVPGLSVVAPPIPSETPLAPPPIEPQATTAAEVTSEPEAVEPPPPEDPLKQAEQAKIEPIPGLPTETNTTGESAPSEAAARPAPAGKTEGKPAAGEANDVIMMRFLSKLLSEIKKTRPTLDSYNRFGIDLVLTGGIEFLGNQTGLGWPEKRNLLRSTIEVMGASKAVVTKFTDKYEEYLAEPRYLVMVQTGRVAMEGFLAGSGSGMEMVRGAFDAWNKPQVQQAPSRVVTVLFTDMVGSTDMTQSLGDQAAQEAVRRHNAIVRSALAELAGKEIKHTGDGIMASFASPANGVEAAVTIQRAIKAHCDEHPEMPIAIRIGMDAGEPIEEDDDLFGTTVQLASRVCAAAQSGQIMCTNVVRELSAGKGREFLYRGRQNLKGFKEKVAVYEVLWADEPNRTEPTSEETETAPSSAEAFPPA